jgi:hypothetical protein
MEPTSITPNIYPRRPFSWRFGILLIVLAAIAGSGVYALLHRSVGVAGLDLPKNRYYAVYLNGGQFYFGQLQTGLRPPYAVLTNVFYVQSRRDEQTKQVSTVLVKRGKEWHEPDRMYLNVSQIILIEPVGTTSRVAQLIAEANR